MKGQIFIITSVLVLVALLLTRLATKTVDKKQDDTFYESFSNLKNELIRTIDIALLNEETISDKLDDFIYFSNETMKKRGYIESVNYSVFTGTTTIVYLNVSLSSDDSYFLESLIINRTVYT